MNTIKDFAKRLAVTIIDLLTSKKAIATGVSFVAAHVIKDPTQRVEVIGAVVAFVFSQGWVDHGKAIAEGKIGAAGVAPLPVVVVGDSQPLVPAVPAPAVAGAIASVPPAAK